MPTWDYEDGVPLVPVRIVGRELSISSLALVDTGAKSCVLRDRLAKAMGLEFAGKESFEGFGGTRAFRAALVEGRIELAGSAHTVSFAAVGDAHFPRAAPSVVLGRNLPRLFKVTLDGPNKTMTVDPGL